MFPGREFVVRRAATLGIEKFTRASVSSGRFLQAGAE